MGFAMFGHSKTGNQISKVRAILYFFSHRMPLVSHRHVLFFPWVLETVKLIYDSEIFEIGVLGIFLGGISSFSTIFLKLLYTYT